MSAEVKSGSVLLLGTDLSTGGGVNRVIVDLAALLRERIGLAVTIANARGTTAPSYALGDGVTVLQGSGRSIGAYLRFLWRLRSLPFETVVSFWSQDNVLAILMLLGSGKRVVACEHTSFHDAPLFVRLVRGIAYRLSHAVTVLNDRELAHYHRRLSNVVLVPNPIRPLPRQHVAREKIILAVGHLIPRKGFDDLIAAYALSEVATEGWRLHIVGAGPERDRLQAMIDERVPNAAVVLPPLDNIADLYQSARIIVVPSRIEVFSLVLAEAALTGVIPLAYDVDGPAYLLHHFPQLLVPAGDVEALGERLRSLCCGEAPDPAVVAEAISRLTAPDVIAGQWRSILAPIPSFSTPMPSIPPAMG